MTNSESENQQSTSQMNESERFYQENFVSFVEYQTFVNSCNFSLNSVKAQNI